MASSGARLGEESKEVLVEPIFEDTAVLLDKKGIDQDEEKEEEESYEMVSEPFSPKTTAPTFSSEEKKPVEDVLNQLQVALNQTVTLFDTLSKINPTLVNMVLKETFGLHTMRSFGLVAQLTEKLNYLTKELLRPDPPPLLRTLKDGKAYGSLKNAVKDSPPLTKLLKDIWEYSRFLNIGTNIGTKTPLIGTDIQLSAISLNGGWLPEFLGWQLNPFLRSNKERVEDAFILFNELMDHITSVDFICFQEAWKRLFEGPVRESLKKYFTTKGYFAFGDDHDKLLSFGTGVLGFSKHPIVDRSFQEWTRRRVGTETLAGKGVDAVKVLVNGKYILTIVTAHETSGDGIFSKDKKIVGTSSQLRSDQEQKILRLCVEWRKEPVINPETGLAYPHLGEVFLIDRNTASDDLYKLLQISSGGSTYDERERGNIKYEGPFNFLLDTLVMLNKECWPFPMNHLNVRAQKMGKRPDTKALDPELVEKALKEDKFTGSTYSVKDLKENKIGVKSLSPQMTERSVIDLLMVRPSHREALKAFESYLVHTLNHSGKAFSDHLMLFAVMLFAKPADTPLPSLKMHATTFAPKSVPHAPSDPEVTKEMKVATLVH